MDAFSAQVTALEQGLVGRDAEYGQHLNKVLTQQTVVRAQQDVAPDQVQSSGGSEVQPGRMYSRSRPAKSWHE